MYWIIDTVGGCGKSFLSQNLISDNGALLLANFANKDNAYLYQGEPWVIFDIPRDTDLPNASFQIIEDLKNGYLISQKYEFRRKILTSPKVVVFSNTYPPKETLSADRWNVYVNYVNYDLKKLNLHHDETYNNTGEDQ